MAVMGQHSADILVCKTSANDKTHVGTAALGCPSERSAPSGINEE
jgi:hypothetical protein